MNKQDIFGRGKENGYNNKTGDIKEKQILDRQEEWKVIANKAKAGLPLTQKEKAVYILFIASKEEAAKMLCTM